MSQYYKSRRTKYLYEVNSKTPFRISRSKIDLFLNCPKCFYLDRKLGVGQPPGYPFSLNSAVDKLLKKEFDVHRLKGTTHPLMTKYGIEAVPINHADIDNWRNSLTGGITYLDEKTNLLITGGVDDVWVNKEGELIIVDYKATSKTGGITLDADWQIGYKRQMEIYQWLFMQNGFKVSSTGYFVYCNGDADKKAFDGKLEFNVTIIPYLGDTSWVADSINQIHKTLATDRIPESATECDFCAYRKAVHEVEQLKNIKLDEDPQKSLF